MFGQTSLGKLPRAVRQNGQYQRRCCRRWHTIMAQHCAGASPADLQSNVARREMSTGGALQNRRVLLGGLILTPLASLVMPAQASTLAPVVIKPELAPDQRSYDPSDPDLREAALLLQQGLEAPSVEREEAIWTQIIEKYGSMDKPWVPDVVGRAWGNRGNARSRQGKLQEALEDYNMSIAICPWSVDPVLNRGVALEGLSRFEEAISDYKAVLAVAPDDPAGWNNLGNASNGLGRWNDAVQYYSRAISLAPSFSFAVANRALAMYQLGRSNEAIKEYRTLLRRYPDFTDMRAALAASMWAAGKEADAESNWERVDDARYKDRVWLRSERRWPPKMVEALENFLDLKSVA